MTWTHIPVAGLVAEAERRAGAYRAARPFPHAVLDDFFAAPALAAVADEFPDLARWSGPGAVKSYDDPLQRKFASVGEAQFGERTRALAHFLNSLPFLEFLSALTGIAPLLPDPYFEGGGLHEIRRGGLLKVHADFNKHRASGLDRRLNVLVYLNRDWDDAWGGHLELWDRDMRRAEVRLAPRFNRMVVFSTDDLSFHGHPDPLDCPPTRSRRSLALYYYTNGRRDAGPAPEERRHSTLFQARPGTRDAADARRERWISPLQGVARLLRGLAGRVDTDRGRGGGR